MRAGDEQLEGHARVSSRYLYIYISTIQDITQYDVSISISLSLSFYAVKKVSLYVISVWGLLFWIFSYMCPLIPPEKRRSLTWFAGFSVFFFSYSMVASGRWGICHCLIERPSYLFFAPRSKDQQQQHWPKEEKKRASITITYIDGTTEEWEKL